MLTAMQLRDDTPKVAGISQHMLRRPQVTASSLRTYVFGAVAMRIACVAGGLARALTCQLWQLPARDSREHAYARA